MAYEIDFQSDSNPWQRLPRRFDTLEEAQETAKKVVDLYIVEAKKSFAIQYRKVMG